MQACLSIITATAATNGWCEVVGALEFYFLVASKVNRQCLQLFLLLLEQVPDNFGKSAWKLKRRHYTRVATFWL